MEANHTHRRKSSNSIGVWDKVLDTSRYEVLPIPLPGILRQVCNVPQTLEELTGSLVGDSGVIGNGKVPRLIIITQLKISWAELDVSVQLLQGNPSLPFVLFSSQPLKGFYGVECFELERVIRGQGKWERVWDSCRGVLESGLAVKTGGE
ncbi:hypothetical protein Tco_0415112, partial [Tanacetum coccineum]